MSTRRRGNGEGSIVQRADGQWMTRIGLGWRDGKLAAEALQGIRELDMLSAVGREGVK